MSEESINTIDSNTNIKMKLKRKFHNCCRRSICKIVPRNHFGPIPGVPVGSSWKYRIQVSESGVHRPLVAGIHGRESEGAYSIVLSGVYKEDKDDGNEFLYSGCGGKEKDPRKRLGLQVMDQELRRHNLALALCCYASVDEVIGADAKDDWRKGKPVRVVRKCTSRGFSIYSPSEGYRYDGIYKVVRYYPVYGISGLKVWTYVLRRDDVTPAPWTEEGIQLIEKLNLKMQVPEEYEVSAIIHTAEKIAKKIKSKIILKTKNKKKRLLKSSQTRKVVRMVEPYRKLATLKKESDREEMLTDPAGDVPDVDIKPDLRNLSFASGANIPWTTSNSIYNSTSVPSYPNELSEFTEASHIKISHCETSHTIDVEDVKPDINKLNALMNCQEMPFQISNVSSLNTIKCETFDETPNSFNSEVSRKDNTIMNHNEDQFIHFAYNNPNNNSWNDNVWNKDNSYYSVKEEHSIPKSYNNFLSNKSENGLKDNNEKFDKENVSILKTVTGRMMENEKNWIIPQNILNLLAIDAQNGLVWDYLKTFRLESEFIRCVKMVFGCPICCDVVHEPITTPCGHNVCFSCLSHHFTTDIRCPQCYFLLPPDCLSIGRNYNLEYILNFLLSKEAKIDVFLPKKL